MVSGINLANTPGTICMRPDGYTYIIGATDEENEAFRKRLQNFDSSKLDAILDKNGGSFKEAIKNGDLVELTSLNGVTRIEYGSETYNNLLKVKGMPKSIFSINPLRGSIHENYNYQVTEKIRDFMRDFYKGNKNPEEMKSFFSECCSDMRIYCCQERYTNGKTEDDNKQIIGQVYEIFAKQSARAARFVNSEEGKEYYRRNNFGGYDDDIVYYNSDYYYMCKDAKETLRGLADSVAEKWEISSKIDYDEIEANTAYTFDGLLDFNSSWTFEYKNIVLRGKIEDCSVKPPRGFKFFYKESDKDNKSILKVWADGCVKSTNIPFYSGSDGLKGQKYNLAEIVKFTSQNTGKYAEYNEFMKNVSIFTRWYSYASGYNQ